LGYEYIHTNNVCPIGIQKLQEENKFEETWQTGMFSSYCMAWSIWYIQARLSLPHLSAAQTLNILLKVHERDPDKLTGFIRGYATYLKNNSSTEEPTQTTTQTPSIIISDDDDDNDKTMTKSEAKGLLFHRADVEKSLWTNNGNDLFPAFEFLMQTVDGDVCLVQNDDNSSYDSVTVEVRANVNATLLPINILFENIDGLADLMSICKTRDIIIIPVAIEINTVVGNHIWGHQNVALVNNLLKQVEYYEPYGKSYFIVIADELSDKSLKERFGLERKNVIPYAARIDRKIKQFFNEHFVEYEFININNVCPIGLQTLQEDQSLKETDETGMFDNYCMAWSLWYIQARLALPHLSAAQALDIILKVHRNDPKKLTGFIRGYATYLKNKSL